MGWLLGTIHHWWKSTAAAFESASKALDRREDEREAWRAIQVNVYTEDETCLY